MRIFEIIALFGDCLGDMRDDRICRDGEKILNVSSVLSLLQRVKTPRIVANYFGPFTGSQDMGRCTGGCTQHCLVLSCIILYILYLRTDIQEKTRCSLARCTPDMSH